MGLKTPSRVRIPPSPLKPPVGELETFSYHLGIVAFLGRGEASFGGRAAVSARPAPVRARGRRGLAARPLARRRRGGRGGQELCGHDRGRRGGARGGLAA